MYYRLQKAFTLLEILMVVVVLGILTTLAMPQFTAMRWRARYAEVFTVVGAIARAKELYYLEYGTYGDAGRYSIPDCRAGDTIPTGSTLIQKDLGLEIPEDCFFMYLIYPGGTSSTTRIYFREMGYSYAWYYDYVTKTWYKYDDYGGPAQDYFHPPS